MQISDNCTSAVCVKILWLCAFSCVLSLSNVFFVYLKKTAAKSYHLLQEAYGNHAPLKDMCEWWFRNFKSGDFDVAKKKYKDLQTKHNSHSNWDWELLHKLFLIAYKKSDRWAPHELNNRQME